MRLIFLALLAVCDFPAQTTPAPTAADIMSRVAINQDREQKVRNQFVYEQKIHRTERSKNGKLLCEEFWTYAMTPGPKGTERKLLLVKGRYWKKGAYIPFEGLPLPSGFLRITFDDDGDSKTRDGIDSDLFPLTSDKQKDYSFGLLGERIIHDRPAYRIQFQPADPKDWGWKGEALIDKEEFQPVSVFTRLSRKLPFAVRTMLGTDVPGLGFGIQYTRVDKDIWFPATYGDEFDLHALFFLNRTFTESMENSNFRRANVESKIEFSGAPEQ